MVRSCGAIVAQATFDGPAAIRHLAGMTPDRLVELERVLNFRDFGGYDTPDGRVVRGKLYRSAHFHEATDADMERLDALGVRFIVDLRRSEERSGEPNRWPGEGVRSISSDEGVTSALPPHLQALLQSDLTAASVASYMHTLYREFAAQQRHIQLYSEWFRELARGEGAGVIHCAAGKDRTGLGCALTLYALGVDDDAIFADYEYTNSAMNIEARLPRIQARMEERLGRKLNADALRPMLSVDPAYLHTAFASIDEQYGSRDGYLEVLGIGVSEREALRENLIG
ncbi:MAG: tyrosine-protein phosphatase [Proteobacteria bacterium]|nr:tyrosine-protein phosphatase [Pseudomonadota bacterium]